MLKVKYKIRKTSIFSVLLAIFIIRPYYIQIHSGLNTIWAYITVVLGAWSIYRTASVIKTNKKTATLLTVFYVYCILYIFATIMNESSNTFSAISECAQMIGGFNLGLLVLISKYKESATVVMRKVFTGYLYLDAILGFLNIGSFLGLSKTLTFLGYDNYALYSILPMLSIKFALDYQKNRKIKGEDWFCWLICLSYKIQTMSLNGILCLLLFGLVCFIAMHRVDIRNLFTPQKAIVIVAFLVLGVNVFGIQNFFSKILVSLGKGTTLGYRTVIWNHTISALFSTPLWGYGHINNGSFQTIVGLSPIWDVEANHAHNLLMEVWFSNGIIGLILYSYIVGKCAKGMKRKWYNSTYKLLICGVTTYILMGFIDGYPYISVSYTLFSLLFCIGVRTEMRK